MELADLLPECSLANVLAAYTEVVLEIPGEISIWAMTIPHESLLPSVAIVVRSLVVGDMSESKTIGSLHFGKLTHEIRVSYVREDRTTYLTLHGDTVYSYTGPSAEQVALALMRFLYQRLKRL